MKTDHPDYLCIDNGTCVGGIHRVHGNATDVSVLEAVYLAMRALRHLLKSTWKSDSGRLARKAGRGGFYFKKKRPHFGTLDVRPLTALRVETSHQQLQQQLLCHSSRGSKFFFFFEKTRLYWSCETQKTIRGLYMSIKRLKLIRLLLLERVPLT